MHYIRVDETSTREQLAECIAHLRIKAKACKEPEIRAAIGDDVDELVEMIVAKGPA